MAVILGLGLLFYLLLGLGRDYDSACYNLDHLSWVYN